MKTAEKNVHAVALGTLGGQAVSPAKSQAARENGKKGGRPPKTTQPPKGKKPA